MEGLEYDGINACLAGLRRSPISSGASGHHGYGESWSAVVPTSFVGIR